MTTPHSDEWFTPLQLLQDVQLFYKGDFLDPASCRVAQSLVKATKFWTVEDNALLKPWDYDKVWLNPPYSRALFKDFVVKALQEYCSGRCKELLVLVNSTPDTTAFQSLTKLCTLRLDFYSRLSFWHPDKKTGRNSRGQSLFYFGPNKDFFLEIFGVHGLVYGPPINATTQGSINVSTQQLEKQKFLDLTKTILGQIEEKLSKGDIEETTLYCLSQASKAVNLLWNSYSDMQQQSGTLGNRDLAGIEDVILSLEDS